jgi:hypothetical protein
MWEPHYSHWSLWRYGNSDVMEFVLVTTAAVEVLWNLNNIGSVVLWREINTGITRVLLNESNNTASTRDNNPHATGILWREKNTRALEVFRVFNNITAMGFLYSHKKFKLLICVTIFP